MLAVSTFWRSRDVRDGGELLDEVLGLGTGAIELEYRIRKSTFDQMQPLIRRRGVEVTSIHNFFPDPELPGRPGSGDLFLFSSEDPEERDLAVKHTVRALEIAAELGAKALILHLGKVPIKDETDTLKVLYDEGKTESPEGEAFLSKMLDERTAKAPRAVDRVMSCLDRLLKVADRLDVVLGCENRFHPPEIPSPDELDRIFAEFAGSKAAYWHDVGHAAAHEAFGVIRQRELLDRFADRMAGVHLHDAKGHRDHKPPGTGEVDFAMIKGYLRPETIKVVELGPKVERDEVLRGLEYLKSIGIS